MKPKSAELLKGLSNIVINVPNIGPTSFSLYKEVSIAAYDLEDVFVDHPEQFMFWSSALASARILLRDKEEDLVDIEAERFMQYRAIYKEAGDYYTDKLLDCEVRLDKSVVKLRKEVHDLKEDVILLESVKSAFEHRKASIISLGAHIRDVHGSRTSINERRRPQG